jgi:transferase CAF17, mitochondrial
MSLNNRSSTKQRNYRRNNPIVYLPNDISYKFSAIIDIVSIRGARLNRTKMSIALKSQSNYYSYNHYSYKNFVPSKKMISKRTFAQLCYIKNKSILKLKGPDSQKFLQGLTTNQMMMLDDNRGMFCNFLSPQGRVLFDAFVYSHNGFYLVEIDSHLSQLFQDHLKRYRLRSLVNIETANLAVWQAWPKEGSLNEAFDAIERHSETLSMAIRDPRHENMGFRFLLPLDENPTFHGEIVSHQDYQIKRILLGVAEGKDDFVYGTSLPLECNSDLMNGSKFDSNVVDFRKGCYLGQELTIRTHHNGVVRKRLVPIQCFDGDEPSEMNYHSQPVLETGQEIFVQGKEKPVGRVSSVVGNIGLGLVRLEHIKDSLRLKNGHNLKPFPSSFINKL